MSKQNYKETMKGLSDKLKSQPIKTPIQEVRPVNSQPIAGAAPAQKDSIDPIPAKEAHVNFWTSLDLMKRLKMYSAQSGKSIKQICTEALEAYLGANR